MAIGLAAATIGAGIATAGSSIGSSIYQTERGIANSNWQNELNREWSSAEAQKARDFEKMMSDTSYQRQIADMKAAGLNPAGIGASGGASTPNASAPSASSTSAGVGRAFGFDLFSSAVQRAIARDHDIANKITQELKVSSARELEEYRQQGKLQLAEMYKPKHSWSSSSKVDVDKGWREL